MSLRDVPPENEFVLIGGKRIKNIVELGRELKQMSEEAFAYHVNEHKNDFAIWIQACVKDDALATLARMTKNRERMSAIVERRIQELTRPPPQPKKIEAVEPSIIRTRNVTLLALKQPVVNTGKVTQLTIEPPRKIIHSPHKTMLKLDHAHTKEIYVHEVNKQHHSAALLISHLVLGIVVGVAIAALVLAFSNI